MNRGWLPPLAAVLLLLPFAGKAFHVDDPLFLWAAKRIAEHPADPYGGFVNWYGTEAPLHEVAQNPPLASCFAALAGSVLGWSELALHLAFLLPAALAAAGIHRLARRFTSEPVFAALAAVVTPAFVVCGTTIMSDVLMLALFAWALDLWIEGTEERRHGKLAGAALLAALAALAKYSGAGSIALMAVWSIARRRRPDLVWLLLPAGMLAAFELWTRGLYGHGLLASAAGYVGVAQREVGQPPLARLAVAIAFVGGAIPLAATRRPLALGTPLAIGALLAAALVLTRPRAMPWLFLDDGIYGRVVAQLAIFAGVGLAVLDLVRAELQARRDAASVLLALWVAGTLAFAALLNWTVNARSLLPMAPAIGILLARRLEGRSARPILLAPVAALSLLVALADLRLANAGREAARAVHALQGRGPGALWFQGHWGFQHYLQELGGRPLDLAAFELAPGDRIVVPLNATNTRSMPAGACELVQTLSFPTLGWLATMETTTGAGFHAGAFGCLPYSFGPMPPERYDVLRVTRAISAR